MQSDMRIHTADRYTLYEEQLSENQLDNQEVPARSPNQQSRLNDC